MLLLHSFLRGHEHILTLEENSSSLILNFLVSFDKQLRVNQIVIRSILFFSGEILIQ